MLRDLRWRIAAAACLAVVGVAGCGNANEATKNSLLDVIVHSLAKARTFTFVDHDLVGTSTVSGAIADDQRYQMLLSVDGSPQWQMVVHDDAVANYFPARDAVRTYTGSGYGPADDVVAALDQVAPVLPPERVAVLRQIYQALLPKPTTVPPSLALASLEAGKWVVDPAGAPGGAGAGEADVRRKLTSSPFYEPLDLLLDLQQRVQQLNPLDVHQWRKGDLQPTFKATDDPFPAPASGEDRYDIKEPPLPTPSLNTARGIPDPPTNDDFLKIAVYVRDGLVSAIRYNYDVLDRLDDVVKSYKIPASFGKAVGVNLEEHVGQVLVDMIQGEQNKSVPFRVHEETLLLQYPATPPTVAIPSPAVTVSLAGLIPGQGAVPARTSVTAPPTPAGSLSSVSSPSATPSG